MGITVPQLRTWKQQGRTIAALTATEFTMAQILDQAGVDIILVGDSLAMVSLGYKTTLPLTLDQMIHHAQAVGRAVSNALLVVDLPFMTYQVSVEQALASAGRILKETEAQAVKLEGGDQQTLKTIARLVEVGVPVMGHVGVTPQAVRQRGYKQRGKQAEEAQRLVREAMAIAESGAFAIVLENIPPELAQEITQTLDIPTLGIGAGQFCDGQILVTHDLLGLSEKMPPFVAPMLNLRALITKAVQEYCQQVHG
ncbi:MAG: 3-methyl-2-oxobutanoate hydroxymethyltransferase [Pseudanabaenaceae cyanobacterium]